MPFRPDPRSTPLLLGRARRVVGMSQRQMADALGVARRTIARWEAGNTNIGIPELQSLAALVHPADASLAAEIVAETGTTIEELGLAPPVTPPPGDAAAHLLPAASPSPAVATAPAGSRPRAFPPVELTIDSVLYVAVKALQDAASGDPESTVQAVLRAAISRARGLGLTLEEVERGLGTTPRG
jgi:transcriptional regulator with XRE-family HTH domain